MERVLEGMHKIAVADMVAEASVRKHIRELYIKYAVVSTGTQLQCRQTMSSPAVINMHAYTHRNVCTCTHVHTHTYRLLVQSKS